MCSENTFRDLFKRRSHVRELRGTRWVTKTWVAKATFYAKVWARNSLPIFRNPSISPSGLYQKTKALYIARRVQQNFAVLATHPSGKSRVWISPSRVRTPHFCKALLSTKESQPSWIRASKDKRRVSECLKDLSASLYLSATHIIRSSLSSQIRGNGEEVSRNTSANLHIIDVSKPSLLNKGQDCFTNKSMQLAQQ